MPDLEWHFGPTVDDPDPGSRWHDDCGGRIDVFKDGVFVCACGQRDTVLAEDIPQRIADIAGDEWWTSSGEETFRDLADRLMAAGIEPQEVISILSSAYGAVAEQFGG